MRPLPDGVTALDSTAVLPPPAFTARSSKVWAVSLASFVTVNPSSLNPPVALWGIVFQSSG